MVEEHYRIAVVDDEASVRKALGRLLRSAHLDARTFPSGAELLAAIATYHPNCIVLDLHMPQMNGFEVQDRLAAAAARIPVVVITGYDTPEGRARALAGGAAAYLLKPVDERTLLDAIAAAVTGDKC